VRFALIDEDGTILATKDAGRDLADSIAAAILENVKLLQLRPTKQHQVHQRVVGILYQTLKDLGLQAHKY
jgi:hypothetical protein